MVTDLPQQTNKVKHITMIKFLVQGTTNLIDNVVIKQKYVLSKSLLIGLELYTTEYLKFNSWLDFDFPNTPIKIEKLLKKPLNEWKIQWDESVQELSLNEVLLESFTLEGQGKIVNEILESYDTSSTDEIIQKDFYYKLKEIASKYDNPDQTYTELRGFIVQYPIVMGFKTLQFIANPEIFTQLLQHSHIFEFYIDLPVKYIDSNGKLFVCNTCGYPIYPKGKRRHIKDPCLLKDPEGHYVDLPSTRISININSVKIVHPKVWEAWCLPGISEIELYKEFIKLKSDNKCLIVELYPDGDKLDVGIRNEQYAIGIDLKDYPNPRKLVKKIKKDIEDNHEFSGGYWDKWNIIIYAVPKHHAVETNYIPLIQSELGPALPEKVHILDTDMIIKKVTEIFK